MSLETKQKLEAIIRVDIENMPYKFRDIHHMMYHGITAYKDLSEEEILDTFKDMELEITEQDKEWANHNK